MADDTEDLKDQQADDVDEQSEEESEDQADDDSTGVDDEAEGDDDEGADDEDGEEEADGEDSEDEDEDDEDKPLISDDDFNKLKNDPDKLRKELQSAATKKFQKLSAARKAVEPYAEFLKSYEDNPREAAIALAQQLGIEVKIPEGKKKAEEAVEKIADKVSALVKKQLGPEYADVAEKLGSAVYEAARMVAEDAIKPLRDDQDKIINDASTKEAQAEIAAFSKKYPDWKKHEGAMTKIAAKLKPTEGMTPGEYMEAVYHLATRKQSKGEAMKEAVKKLNKSTSKPGKERTVSDKSVSKKPGHIPSWDESVEAAERGERFD